MRRLPALVLLAGCATGAPTPDTDTAAVADTGADTADSGDSAAACVPPTSITVTGELVAGQTVQLGVGAPGDPGPISWSISGDDAPGEVSAEGAWAIPEDIADLRAEDLTIHATACDTELTLDVEVDWPETDRVVVVYNPAVDGSLDVADAYASFRVIPAEALCPVESTTGDTLAGADYPAFVDAVFACVTPHTLYIVPVWGVPYKVSDRVLDLAYGTPATVSLDALLFAGPASVDITRVDQNPAYVTGNSTTGKYSDYRPFGQIRGRVDAWMVTRIDGASAAEAIELVDRTREAEEYAAAGLLDGTVYVDGNEGDTPPPDDAAFGSYQWGEWNMWGTRRVFEGVGAYPVVWDGNSEEFGTAPAPTSCPDALYYAGWYSFYNYNDCFDWTVGAIGGHLDSCSACDIRNPGTWAGSALLDGITATFGAVNEPYVAGMPEYDQFFFDLLEGASFGEAAYESTVEAYWMMVWVGDPLYRPYRDAPLIPVE
jgi:uncharacterized protein (TIGR03790 family)